MRIWHVDLLPVLPLRMLKEQWRDIHLIAKNIYEKGKPGSVVVNRVTKYPVEHFWKYAVLCCRAMERKGYTKFQSRNLEKYFRIDDCKIEKKVYGYSVIQAAGALGDYIFYPWHDKQYLIQCFYMLQERYDCGVLTDEEYDEIRKLMLMRNIRV